MSPLGCSLFNALYGLPAFFRPVPASLVVFEPIDSIRSVLIAPEHLSRPEQLRFLAVKWAELDAQGYTVQGGTVRDSYDLQLAATALVKT